MIGDSARRAWPRWLWDLWQGILRNAFARALPYNLDRQNNDSWHGRAAAALDLLSGTGQIPSVAEIGCGDRKFGRLLAERHPTATYHGFDIIPQSPEVSRFDLTRDDLPGHYDAVVILGVLEYLDLSKNYLAELRRRCRHLVVSYGARELKPEVRFKKPRSNLLPNSSFEAMLRDAGFDIINSTLTPNGKQSIWFCR